MKFILILTFGILALCPCRAQKALTKAVLIPNVQHDFLKERVLLRWKHANLSAGVSYEKTMLPAAADGLMENNRQYTAPVFYRRDLGNNLYWESGLYAGMGRGSYTGNVFFPNETPDVAPYNELIYGAIAGLGLVVSENLSLSLRFRETFGTGPRANFGKLRMGWRVRF